MTHPARKSSAWALALTLAWLLNPFSAVAQNTAPPVPLAAASPNANPAPRVAKPYAIEFRARNAHSYGHTFAIHGRVNAQGRFVNPRVSGLHPATENPVPWMIGHIVAVPSETGASDGDTEDQYVIARFRVALSEAEYKRVMAFIKQLADKSPVWHAVLYNCNTYVGDIARFMGLSTPGSTMLMPQDYIDRLRDLNLARTDVAKLIGTPVKVADAASLRAAALNANGQRIKRTASDPARPQPGGAAGIR